MYYDTLWEALLQLGTGGLALILIGFILSRYKMNKPLAAVVADSAASQVMKLHILEPLEYQIIKIYLYVRGAVALFLATLVGLSLYFLATELTGVNPNAALTALLGIGFGGLSVNLGTIIQALSVSILDYLKDRLGTAQVNPDLKTNEKTT